MSAGNLARLERDGVALVCLSYVNPRALQHARRLVRRLRQHFRGGVPILLGLWHAEPSEGDPRDALATTGADLLATSLAQAAELVEGALGPAAAEHPAPAEAAGTAVAGDLPKAGPQPAAAAGASIT